MSVTKWRTAALVLAFVTLGALLMLALMPVFATNGDYGVNSGAATATPQPSNTPAPTATPGSQYCSESEPGIWSVKAPYSNYPTIQGDDFDSLADCESEAQERASNAS